MQTDFDLARFGKRLREVRSESGMTLREVQEKTGISIQTLSRVERGDAKEIESNTLLTLANWAKLPLALFEKAPIIARSRTAHKGASTPDVVELHLRADKNLNKTTAQLLAKMFRAAYTQLVSEIKE